MKTFVKGVLGAFALLLLSQTSSFAIEGIQVSVACSNVVLSWPSIEGETYIVQHRQSLTDTNGWQTLVSFLPADLGTNLTCFVHSNAVLNPGCGCAGSSFAMMASGGGNRMSLASSVAEALPPVPMVIPANGIGRGVPLALYPPGTDLSGLLIFDPVSGETMSGVEFLSPLNLRMNGESEFSAMSLGGQLLENNSSSTQAEPETGFYRVVRNGAHIFGLTNGMVLSGRVQLPIELALDTTNEIAGVTFYANGFPLIGAMADGDGYHWLLNWDTTMMPNGTYDITAQIDFTADTATTNSQPVTVTVNNAISFPNYFTRIYGSQMWVYAELATPVADFQLDLYDDGTNYLGSFTGSTSDGVISFLWDLTDGYGYTFESTNFAGVFTVTPAQANQANGGGIQPMSSGASSSATNFWVKEARWAANWNDYYVVAYGPFDGGYAASKQLLAMLGGGEGVWGGVIHALSMYGLGVHLSPGNVDQSTAFALSDATAKTNLLNYLADPRFPCFYFFGHGSPAEIRGFDPTSRINFYDIQKALDNYLTSPKPRDFHPYRFVFIDGCSAGEGNFCEAFGIPAMTVSTNFFATAGVNSRAFIGFKSWKNFNPITWKGYSLMIGGFYDDWQSNQYSVQDCVNRALAGVHNTGDVLMDSSVVIYGAANMTHDSP